MTGKKKKSAGLNLKVGLFELGVVAFVIWLFFAGGITITDGPPQTFAFTLETSAVVPRFTSEALQDFATRVSQSATTPMAIVTPHSLPPSHSGGEISGNQISDLAQSFLGLEDHTTYAEPPLDNPRLVHKTGIFSDYGPNLGKTNCSNFVVDLTEETLQWLTERYPHADHSQGWCMSRLSNGEYWGDNVNYADACPYTDNYPFGTKIYAFGQVFECKDHGGGIIENDTIQYVEDGVTKTATGDWIDFLGPHPHQRYKTPFDMYVLKPSQ